MKIKDIILQMLEENGEVRAADVIERTGFSRAYVNRYFRELREEGVLFLVGKANRARYIPATEKQVQKAVSGENAAHRILVNDGLNEDMVLEQIKRQSGIFIGLKKNVQEIVEYAFTEMLNNAIDHSGSEKIEVRLSREKDTVRFEVKDSGIGIFNNIRSKKGLDDIMSAIQDLLKGKQTTAPAAHSGEGIFFSSKVGDLLSIESSQKKLIFDNLGQDVVLRDLKKDKIGTRIVFSIGVDSDKDMDAVFRRYTDSSYKFNKTEVAIKLYTSGAYYVSRSQARRLLNGLDEFRTIILDFEGVDSIGQAFADEIFRVWQAKHPEKELVADNAGENVIFMIDRAKK